MPALARSPPIPRRVRDALGPWIDGLARAVGQRPSRIRRTEYAGTVHRPIEEFEATLAEVGFVWDPISLYHRTPAGSATDGSWAYRPSRLSDRQLHVVLFAQTDERIDVYAHVEYNWLRHPIRHARREDIRRKEGATRVRHWLEDQSIEYDREPVVVRALSHLVGRLRERLADSRPDPADVSLASFPSR